MGSNLFATEAADKSAQNKVICVAAGVPEPLRPNATPVWTRTAWQA